MQQATSPQALKTLKKHWRELLMALALDERLINIKTSLPAPFDLLPSREGSWWYPREWKTGKKGEDTIVVEVSGEDDPRDLFVHEASHSQWTWRSNESNFLLRRWAEVLNVCEDARVEYLASKHWGWVFSSWKYPSIPSPTTAAGFGERDLLLLGIHIRMIANSRGEEVPKEWVDFFGDLWEKISVAYEELILIETESQMEDFLFKYFTSPIYSPSAQLLLLIFGKRGKELYAQDREFKDNLTEAEDLLSMLGGRENRASAWFDASIPAPQVSPALISLLNRLVGDRKVRKPSYVGRYDHRRDIREREDCFRLSSTLKAPRVSIVVDTSGSMEAVEGEVRPLLWGLNSLARRGALEGQVIFVAGGEALPLELPSKRPLYAVCFDGGSNGYKQALPFLKGEDLVLFVSDLQLDAEDVDTVKGLGEKSYFIYGGAHWQNLQKGALLKGFPQKRLIFAPSVVEALKNLLSLLGL